MYQLFHELRTENANHYGSTISTRSLRICKVLEGREDPVSMRELQDLLIKAGDVWAQEHAGYMAVWAVTSQLRKAGILLSAKGGVVLASPDQLNILFAAAVASLIRDAIPDLDGLGNLKREVLNQIQSYLHRTGIFEARLSEKKLGKRTA